MSSRYGRYTSGEKQDEQRPQKSPTECLVDGCPLPGVFRISNDASLCCVHDGEDSSRWASQTARIRNRERLFATALAMTNAAPGTPVSENTIAVVKARGGQEPKRREGEPVTIRTYGAQLKGWLITECRGARTAPPEVKQPIDSWQQLSESIEA